MKVKQEIQANILSKTKPLFCQNLFANILQTQLTVKSHKTNGAYVQWMKEEEDLIMCENLHSSMVPH